MPDVKALREEVAWRRQLLRTLQMKPAYSAELETCKSTSAGCEGT
jgi:hypothetical protein